MSDFLPARRPLPGWGRGVSLPGRCSGPFRPISTPGGRCCSPTGLGPRTPVPLPRTGPTSSCLRCSPLPGRSAASLRLPSRHPATFHPFGPGPGCAAGPAPSRAPPSRPRAGRPPPRRRDTPRNTHPPRGGSRPAAPAAWTRSRGAAPFPALRAHLRARSAARRFAAQVLSSAVTFRSSPSSLSPRFSR